MTKNIALSLLAILILSIIAPMNVLAGTITIGSYALNPTQPAQGYEPGTTSLMLNIVLNNSDTNQKIVFVDSEILKNAVDQTSAYAQFDPTTSAVQVNVPANGTVTAQLPITIPKGKLWGLYDGNIIVYDQPAPASPLAQQAYQLSIHSIKTLTSTQTSISAIGHVSETKTMEIELKNEGSDSITITPSSFVYDATKFKDDDGDIISISYRLDNDLPLVSLTLLPSDIKKVKVAAAIGSAMDISSYSDNLVLTYDTGKNITLPMNVDVWPEICSNGTKGTDIEISTISTPDSGDDFRPGDTVDVSFDVKNNHASLDKDVEVEAILYDIANDKEIDTAKDSKDINSKDTETFDLSLEIPLDQKEGTYTLFMKAYESGKESTLCNEKSVDVQVITEKYDLKVTDIVVPAEATCGDSITATVNFINIGETKAEEIEINLKGTNFDFDETQSAPDLKRGNSDKVSFTVPIPSDKTTSSLSLEAEITYKNDGDQDTTSHLTMAKSFKLKCENPIKDELRVTETSKEIGKGESADFTVILMNKGSASESFTVEATADWATVSFDPEIKNTSITGDSSKTTSLKVTPKADATDGEHTVKVVLKKGSETIDEETLTVTLSKTGGVVITGKATSISRGTALLGFGIIGVCIVIASLVFTFGKEGLPKIGNGIMNKINGKNKKTKKE